MIIYGNLPCSGKTVILRKWSHMCLCPLRVDGNRWLCNIESVNKWQENTHNGICNILLYRKTKFTLHKTLIIVVVEGFILTAVGVQWNQCLLQSLFPAIELAKTELERERITVETYLWTHKMAWIPTKIDHMFTMIDEC